MEYIIESHSKFLNKVILASQLTHHRLTCIPTLIFLISSFVLLYQHIHRRTSYYSRLKVKVQRELKFHWIYFNATRLWFVLMSCFRKTLRYAEGFIEEHIPEYDQSFNKSITLATTLVVVTSVAIIPMMLAYLNYMYKNEIPNFLMWVVEDPWVRHEIGISGHYLERPIHLIEANYKNYYRFRRSNSFDTSPLVKGSKPVLCRKCKSMMGKKEI